MQLAANKAAEEEKRVARTLQSLQQQMQDKAQEYMLAVQEQAKEAIAQRDSHAAELQQRLVGSEQLLREVRQLQEASSTQLGHIPARRDELDRQLANARRQLGTVAAEREAVGKRLEDLGQRCRR